MLLGRPGRRRDAPSWLLRDSVDLPVQVKRIRKGGGEREGELASRKLDTGRQGRRWRAASSAREGLELAQWHKLDEPSAPKVVLDRGTRSLDLGPNGGRCTKDQRRMAGRQVERIDIVAGREHGYPVVHVDRRRSDWRLPRPQTGAIQAVHVDSMCVGKHSQLVATKGDAPYWTDVEAGEKLSGPRLERRRTACVDDHDATRVN